MREFFQRAWLFIVRGDLLAGLVVALALIPEAIAFSIIAGVDPKVELYASFCITVVIAFAGGRPAMITAVGALDKVVARLRRRGAEVSVLGLNTASATMVERYGLHDKPQSSVEPGAH